MSVKELFTVVATLERNASGQSHVCASVTKELVLQFVSTAFFRGAQADVPGQETCS